MNDLLEINGHAFMPTAQERERMLDFEVSRLAHSPEAEQSAVMETIHFLKDNGDPTKSFDMDRYTPEWYEPGWK